MGEVKSKKRIDLVLVEKGFAETRSKANALILAGQVLVNDVRIDKPGQSVLESAEIRIKDQKTFVSRGGLKLKGALDTFDLEVKDWVCLDVGASTGGFTDCLLKAGAHKVYAVDVGHSQLHWSLVKNPQVISLEKINFRHMDLSLIKDPIDLCVMDVSFISIEKLLPVVITLFEQQKKKACVVFLIKPQFETTPQNVGKGGIVKNEAVHLEVQNKIEHALTQNGFENIKRTDSPLLGADGNREFLIYAEWPLKEPL